MENEQIARRLDEIADLMELCDENEFRIRSYRNAARTVKEHPTRLSVMAEEGEDLSDLPNVGESIAADIDSLLESGESPRLEKLRAAAPEGLDEVMRLRGVGARKAIRLHRALGIDGLDALREACEQGEVRELEDFGRRTEKNILEAIAEYKSDAGRMPLKSATEHAEALAAFLDDLESVDRWQIAGSFRRRKETVGDLDVIVHAADRERAIDEIEDFASFDRLVSRGDKKATLQLESGLRVDFRFFEPDNFGAALMYFTGSKAHNIALRKRAKARGWKMNEYGLSKDGNVLAAREEAGIYHRLNLAWVPPELREDRGEIEASESGELPQLIEAGDVRGDLHCHTEETDGEESLKEMVAAARRRGRDYLAVTDHSQAVAVTQGMDEDRLASHAERIRNTNAALEDFCVFAGVEVDILENGELDIDESVLDSLDWVVASIHSHFDLSEADMTRRLVRAIESGVIHCLGHPLCRQIGHRDPISFDADAVFDACADHGVLLEINANPTRLDLPDTWCKHAREKGAKMVISTDAHKVTDFDFMKYGVDVARRGWLEAGDVANTLDADEFAALIGADD